MDKESNENNENASTFPIASVHNISGDGGAPVILSNVQPVGVYSQEKKGDKYLSKGQKKKRDYTIDTAWQGVRYAGALTIPFTPQYVSFGYSLLQTTPGETSVLIWVYLTSILTPLLGFNNACVYFYPRYKAHRKSNEDKTRFHCVCDTLGIAWKSTWTKGANSETEASLSEPLVDGSNGDDVI
eukprot:scaffold2269_cov149-Skeletonema_menzelii.AAC.4